MSRPRQQVSAALEQNLGCSTIRFRAALRAFAEEFDFGDVNDVFGEWFGDVSVNPAAFRIDRDGRGHVHVWEIESSARLPLHKLMAYGRIADGDGPLCTLHILDRFGNEKATLDNDLLAPLAYADLMNDNYHEGILARAHGTISPAAPAPAEYSILSRNKRERAIVRAVYELGLIKPGENL